MKQRSLLAVVAGTLCVAGTALAVDPPADVTAEPPAKAVAAIPQPALQPEAQPVYIGAGKRDPFRPFTLDIRPPRDVNQPLTPLQQFELGQLKVAGVVAGMSPPRAMVEDSGGMGYIVTIGTPIGRNEGVVKMIEPGRIVVEERSYDFYGEAQLNTVVMVVPSEDGGDTRP